MNTRDTIIFHLDRDYRKPVRDPVWSNIYLSEELLKVIDSAPFRQLSRIKQLGPTFLVYPGATHTRLNHSLGVFHLAKRMIRTLLGFQSFDDMSLDGVKSFLCAALLHDLGHFPYTHSFKELPLKEHETLTAELVEAEPLRTLLRDHVGVDPRSVAAIVDESLPVARESEIVFFRNILSGTLDPDKLDYLNRDAYFCGVPYGLQDIDFILSRLRPDRRNGIALEETGISAVENLLFSKYLMYRAVYWHRTVRVATAMIKKAAHHALEEGAVAPSDFYGLDDELFYLRFGSNESLPGYSLIHRVYNRQLYHPVWESPYRPNDPLHAAAADLQIRSRMEAAVARRLSGRLARDVGPEAVIIDVPERISFEAAFPVITADGMVSYPDSGTVFTPQVVEDFTRTLRKMRLIVEPGITESIRDAEELIASAFADVGTAAAIDPSKRLY
ncbi:MAG: HD domain-containing protein [Spirochaetota bacterium]